MGTQVLHQKMKPDVLQTRVEGRHLYIRTWSARELLPPLRLQSRKGSPKLGLDSSLVAAPIE